MVGTATFLAFLVLAASPPGEAVSTDQPDEQVSRVGFDEPSDKAPEPPPQSRPRDPAYRGKSPSTSEGIPGLPPLRPKELAGEKAEDAPLPLPPGEPAKPSSAEKQESEVKRTPPVEPATPKHSSPPATAEATDRGEEPGTAISTDNGYDAGFGGSNDACDAIGCCEGQDGCPRWTASADFIILDRIGSADQTLVERGDSLSTGAEVLNAGDFHQGFGAGTQLGLIRHGDCGYDVELSYFQIDGWSNAQTVEPNGEVLSFFAPGGFVQRPDDARQAMQWTYGSKLYNAELNVRWNPCRRITMLAGFRFDQLHENLAGTLTPSILQPFWNTDTVNNLYGFQIGAEGIILERGRFSIDGLIKAGIFDNHAEQTSTVSASNVLTPYSASTDHTAFLGEVGLQCKYAVTKRLLLRAGYKAIWLQGVALAPAQIKETNITTDEIGIDSNSGLFYHGATAGFEYSF